MKNRLYTRLKDSRIDRDTVVSVVCVILAISVLAVPAAGQVEDTFTDNFEDGDVDGWEAPGSTNPQISPTSVEGNYSLYAETTGDGSRTVTWTSGPTLNLQDDFTVSGVFRPSFQGQNSIRMGIVNNISKSGDNALLIFDPSNNRTYLGTNQTDTPTSSSNVINNDFDSTWIRFEITSSSQSDLVEAKVWEYGTSEPTEYQIDRQFQGTEGEYAIDVGPDINEFREAWLDSIAIDGTTVINPTLRLDTGNYLGFGETQDYIVYDLVGENEIRKDVTDNTTVTSGNTSVITVDETNRELTATTDENVSTRVNITATYDGRTDIHQVTVASQTIDNLDVLPFFGRIGAMFLDRGFQMILASLLMSIAATRTGGVYAGLGVYQMGLTTGWLIGWVPIGLAFVGLFVTLFVGLNIAANIDYSVRR